MAALSDAADGRVARWSRRRTGDQRPSAGEWLDPIADKVFVIVVLGAIQIHDPAPWAIIGLIVARELLLIPLVMIYRIAVHGHHAFKARAIGKAATIAEFLAIVALIMHSVAIVPLAVAAAALGLAAVIDYIVSARA